MFTTANLHRVLSVVSIMTVGALALAACASSNPATTAEAAQAAASFFSVDGDGVLTQPKGYREWVFIGTPLTPNDMNNGEAPFPEFHHVYIDPVAYDIYTSSGRFPDGTILVKELVSVGSKTAPSGNGYFEGDYIGLEATIKSAKHFPNEPGNWAYYSFTVEGGGQPKPLASPFPTASCNSCHASNAADDFVFTQYYPVLRAATSDVGMHGEPSAKAAPVNEWAPTAPTPARSPSAVPLEKNALFRYLERGRYKKFPAQQSVAHPGGGPHTKPGFPVKVFYNGTLANSLKAGRNEHPRGSSVVKEMYTAEGALQGWAVMTKTGRKTDSGDGWFWYEVTSATDASAIAAMGNGIPGCIGCHSIGTSDMIRSGYPLE